MSTTLRRLELLVTEVRESSDTKDLNSIGPYELMRYFNDAQKTIQKIIFASNPSADIFVKQANYPVQGSSQVAFDLPEDIYAHSSVSNVNTVKDGSIAQTLTRVAYREKQTLWGYSILDKQIVLTSAPQISTISNLLVNYVYKLPTMSYRLGKVTSVDTLTGIVTVDGASIITDEGFSERYDSYSIVDSKGIQSASYLELDDFSGLDFLFTGDLSEVSVGDYVVCGENGTSHSKLPEACEPYLFSYVQKRILGKIASGEVAMEAAFSQQDRQDLEDLFADTVKDALYPVSSDTYYLGY